MSTSAFPHTACTKHPAAPSAAEAEDGRGLRGTLAAIKAFIDKHGGDDCTNEFIACTLK